MMKKVTDDVRLVIKASDLYYNQGLGQSQIAGKLGLSRPTVAKLLEAGHKSGLVRVTIENLDLVKHWDLEKELREKFSLKEVIIVNSVQDPYEQKQLLGQAGARFLEYTIRDGDTVGLSMGTTLHSLVSHMNNPEKSDLTIVPMIGGSGSMRMELHSNSLAERMARILNARYLPLLAPARVSDKSTQRRLMREETFKETLQAMKHIDLALVGIGYPNEDSAIAQTAYYRENEVDYLREKGVAGDICMQFYDADGKTDTYREDNHVVGLPIEKLRRIPLCVGIAGGKEKYAAIRGAILGGFINGLITDEACAKALLEKEKQEVGSDF